MTEKPPEIVATASLSPISPYPIPLHSTSPALVPKLQDHAAALDLAASQLASPHLAPTSASTMAPNSDTTEPADTIVVAGDYTDESADESAYDSFDAYGEDDEEQEQKNAPDSVNDDYAITLDGSPTDQDHQSEAGEAQPDVSEAAESMNSSSASDSMKSQSPHPAPTSDRFSSPHRELPVAHGATQNPSAMSQPATSEGSSALPSGVLTPSRAPAPVPVAAASAPISSPSNVPVAPASAAFPDASASAAALTSTPEHADDGAVDIQKLVDDITANAAASAAPPMQPAQATPSQNVSTTLTITPSASLPPKPSVSHQQPSHLPAVPQASSFQSRSSNSLPSPVGSLPAASPATQRGPFSSAGAPGTTNDGFSSLPPPPPSTFGASHAQAHQAASASAHRIPNSPAIHQGWETFLSDEKRYTSEAKWERFPEGSRIFIGNLSSERVSKREVYDVFSKFGRLAQISLKNAYGFVQYHTVAEGMAAMQNAQGVEMGGRKIHLEISKAQKKKGADERDRSPDRRGQRGERVGDRGGHGGERHDPRNLGWRRDDYRPGRSPSPRRNDARGSRDGFPARDRDFSGYERRRSRSPPRFGRNGPESYRTRSRSPHRRAPSDGGLDLPRRYGSDVPDVQLLSVRELPKDFLNWVQRAFHERGLKTDVMFLKPHFPREALVQRQVLEGVHGIIELDYNAQVQGKISIQIFSRPTNENVRFELYQGLDPPMAAALVLREKTKSAPVVPPSYPPAAYPQNTYPSEATPAVGYGYAYPHASAPPLPAPPVQAVPAMADLASVVGQLNNSDLQALLASLQPAQAAPAYQASVPTQMQPAVGTQNHQLDLNALLGNLRNPPANQAAPMPGYGGMVNYGAAPAYMPHGGNMASTPAANAAIGFGGGDTAQHVQTIMEQLKRAAQ